MTRDITLRQLRYLRVLGEELHFGRAARRLNMAQPALSEQIQRLEDVVGAPLLQRKPRVALTPAGQTLLLGAEKMISDLDLILESTRRAARGETGNLSVALVASTLLLPEITRAFRDYTARYPCVRLSISAMDSADQIEALKMGRVDLGILRDPPSNSQLWFEELARERFVIALPSGHPLSDARDLALAAVDKEKFIMFPRRVSPGIHDRILGLCRSAGFEPEIVQEVGDVQTRLGMVAAGVGITITAASLERLKYPEVAFKTIRAEGAWTPVALCGSTERPLTATAAALCGLLLGQR